MLQHVVATLLTCHNPNFLTSGFTLSPERDGIWLLKNNHSSECYLEEVENKLFPIDERKCFLKNHSRPNTLRSIMSLEIPSRNYLRLSLDNSFAEYGPQKLTSFVYCKSANE